VEKKKAPFYFIFVCTAVKKKTTSIYQVFFPFAKHCFLKQP